MVNYGLTTVVWMGLNPWVRMMRHWSLRLKGVAITLGLALKSLTKSSLPKNNLHLVLTTASILS